MKLKNFVLILLVVCSTKITVTNGAKILGFLVTLSRSHLVFEEPIMRELARRGHEVTVVSAYKSSDPTPLANYRYISIPEFLNHPTFDNFKDSALKNADNNNANMQGILRLIYPLMSQTQEIFKHPKFVELKKESFDLLIVGWFFNDFALGLSGHFHCPSVVVFPNVNNYFMRKLTGSPNSVSTVPFAVFSFKTPMTFFQRLVNFVAVMMEPLMFEVVDFMYNRPMYNEAFPPDIYPTYEEVVKNVSLILLSQHFSERTAEALVPGLIEVAGMHIKKDPSPLPQKIGEFLDSAKDGAIYMSLGSNVRSSDLSEEKLSIFLNKFKSIKQKIVWKFETDLPNKPDNVIIGKWLPQNDILAHPNLKVFISHCGKGGITEAKYHGVPVLGIPLFAEQLGNVEVIVSEGWGVKIPFGDLNAVTFSSVLDEIVKNSTYGQVATKLSKLYRDRPEHPLDKAAFWIEYVIRHNGARHILQSPAIHLNLLQYYSVDVIAFILFVLYVMVKVVRILFNVFLIKVFGIRKRKTKKE